MEEDIQKKLVSFCNFLPSHVELWKNVLQDLQRPVKALANFAEQLRFVEQANIKYLEEFAELQRQLQTKILENIEEELSSIKILTETINKSNHELKNKLATLEKSTIDLNWELNSPVVRGTSIQPPLCKISQLAYEFWVVFSQASKNMNSKTKNINVRDSKSVQEFQKAFSLSLERQEICMLLALTQYVINEKAVM